MRNLYCHFLVYYSHHVYRGAKFSHSKMSLWHEDDFRLLLFKKQKTQVVFTLPPPLTAWNNLNREPVPGRKLLRKITSFYIRKTSLHGMEHICLTNICLLIFLGIAFSPWKRQISFLFSLAQEGISFKPQLLDCPWAS